MDSDPVREWTPVDTADGSRTLFSGRYGQTLHSSHGAATEARWVFLRGSGVEDRLTSERGARVLEIGFGTGLNFLVTADSACQHGAQLEYTALERALPPVDAVRALAYERHLRHPNLAEALRACTAGATPAGASLRTLEVCGARLDLRMGDAVQAIASLEREHFDAVYHDGFSPGANPELWTESFLLEVTARIAPGGVLTTYTVAGEVRRALQRAGLEVEKRPGPPGGKRQMLWARKPLRSRG